MLARNLWSLRQYCGAIHSDFSCGSIRFFPGCLLAKDAFLLWTATVVVCTWPTLFSGDDAVEPMQTAEELEISAAFNYAFPDIISDWTALMAFMFLNNQSVFMVFLVAMNKYILRGRSECVMIYVIVLRRWRMMEIERLCRTLLSTGMWWMRLYITLRKKSCYKNILVFSAGA